MSFCGCARTKKAGIERLDWVFDFSRWLTEGDTINSVTAETSSEFLWELVPINEGDRVRLWLFGGIPGEIYDITLRVTTEKGRVTNERMVLRVVEPPPRPDDWVSPQFVDWWADRIFKDCRLGF